MVVGTQYYPCRGTTKYLIARLADMGKRLVVRFFAQADPLHVSCEIDHVYKGLGPPAACGSVLDCASIQNDGNCLKMNGACSLAALTPGSTFPYRDRVSFFQVQVPQLDASSNADLALFDLPPARRLSSANYPPAT